jgi:hypothetical protein
MKHLGRQQTPRALRNPDCIKKPKPCSVILDEAVIEVTVWPQTRWLCYAECRGPPITKNGPQALQGTDLVFDPNNVSLFA